QAVDALKADRSVYQRNFSLITIARDSKPKGPSDVKRPEGTPVIRPIQAARLREILTRNIQWKAFAKHPDGQPRPIRAHPPMWSVKPPRAREECPTTRSRLGIVEPPPPPPDGSVIDGPGYDERPRLLSLPDAPFPPVPGRPGQDDATAAATRLLGL